MYKVCWPYIFWLDVTSMGTCISLTKVTKVCNMDPSLWSHFAMIDNPF